MKKITGRRDNIETSCLKATKEISGGFVDYEKYRGGKYGYS